MMRWAIAAAAALVCTAGLVWASAEAATEKSAAAAGMYLEETVVGTILTANRMYESDGSEWYDCDLRVDEVEAEKPGVRVGEVLRVRIFMRRQSASEGGGAGESAIRKHTGEDGVDVVHEKAGVVVRERIQWWLAGRQIPGPERGLQVSGPLRLEEGPEARIWVAGVLKPLGRGELVNPGDGAAVDLGSPEAKVLVKMFAPLGIACHQKTADLLKELAGREGERVRVQLFDMRQPEGRREMQRERIRCATVLINNRMSFTLERKEGRREVVLSHRPNEARSSYNSEDVIAVAEGEVGRLYSEGAAEEEKSAP